MSLISSGDRIASPAKSFARHPVAITIEAADPTAPQVIEGFLTGIHLSADPLGPALARTLGGPIRTNPYGDCG